VIDYVGLAGSATGITGDRAEEITRIQSHVSRHRPGARSLLEQRSGTGAIPGRLASRLAVTGQSRSRAAQRTWRI
jgi:hypothetical protein